MDVGVEPGAEMKAAIAVAEERGNQARSYRQRYSGYSAPILGID